MSLQKALIEMKKEIREKNTNLDQDAFLRKLSFKHKIKKAKLETYLRLMLDFHWQRTKATNKYSVFTSEKQLLKRYVDDMNSQSVEQSIGDLTTVIGKNKKTINKIYQTIESSAFQKGENLQLSIPTNKFLVKDGDELLRSIKKLTSSNKTVEKEVNRVLKNQQKMDQLKTQLLVFEHEITSIKNEIEKIYQDSKERVLTLSTKISK